MILIATKMGLNSDCSTVYKSGGFWHQTCQHSSQPRLILLSFQQQISSICCICYPKLHWISAVCHYLSEDVTRSLLCAFILSRLDYCNSFLAGCPKYLLSKLQKVQNNAARLIFRTTRSAHVNPMFPSLHWQPIEQRIEYKLSLLCFKISSGSHLPFRTSSPLHSLPAAPFFYRHSSVQNTILPNKVLWSYSALSLTRIQLSGTNSLLLSAILPLSALLNLPWKHLSF